MITVRDYLALRGRNLWDVWIEGLDVPAPGVITTAPDRKAPGDSPNADPTPSDDRAPTANEEKSGL